MSNYETYDEKREAGLPKWVKETMAILRRTIAELREQNGKLSEAHEVLSPGRNWFTLPGPPMDGGEAFRKFFLLNRDGADCVCSVGRGDVLLIGRAKK